MKHMGPIGEFTEESLPKMIRAIETGIDETDVGYRRGYTHGWINAVTWLSMAFDRTELPLSVVRSRFHKWADELDGKVQDFRAQRVSQTKPPLPWELYDGFNDPRFESEENTDATGQ